MKEKPTNTARMSARKLNPASSRAEGLSQVINTIEISRAVIMPTMLELPENKLAAAGLVWNWNSTNLAV